ncbi:MAG: hypothetical protein ACT4QC_21305 [Planctomycetaceae bacterium]
MKRSSFRLHAEFGRRGSPAAASCLSAYLRQRDAGCTVSRTQSMNAPNRKTPAKWWQVALLAPLVPFILVFLALALVFYLVSTVCLHFTIWIWWCFRGRDILFVYSDSPNWRDHIEQHILPRLGERAVVLNWSQRKAWRFSLARMAFRHFGGSREFNPLAVVFRPFRPTRIFRFWQPLKDSMHGKPEALQRMESEFLALIELPGHDRSAVA